MLRVLTSNHDCAYAETVEEALDTYHSSFQASRSYAVIEFGDVDPAGCFVPYADSPVLKVSARRLIGV